MFIQDNIEQIKMNLEGHHLKPEIGTQSAPIFAENVLDPSMKFQRINQSSRTIYSYKLPTPDDDKNFASVAANTSALSDKPESKSRVPINLWHSSPLVKDVKPSSMRSGSVKMPSSNERISAPLASLFLLHFGF
jgi:hypothetical protein